MHTGTAKAGAMLPMASYLTLVAFGNPTDHDSNFDFVVHGMNMDTIFEVVKRMWRAAESPALHHRP